MKKTYIVPSLEVIEFKGGALCGVESSTGSALEHNGGNFGKQHRGWSMDSWTDSEED